MIEIIEDIRFVFETYFEGTWFSVLLNDLPLETRTMREIKNLISLHFFRPGDEYSVREGVREMESFITCIQKSLLPVIKDKLGVSGFTQRKRQMDEYQYILRQFVLYTFPHNLNRLLQLTEELKVYLFANYPEMIPA
jgi:hypothetical protein